MTFTLLPDERYQNTESGNVTATYRACARLDNKCGRACYGRRRFQQAVTDIFDLPTPADKIIADALSCTSRCANRRQTPDRRDIREKVECQR